MKTKTIKTSNREIYEKFNNLNFSNEIVLRNVKKAQVNKIIKNVNKSSKILDGEYINDMVIIKKLKPFNFHIYLSSKK